MYLYIPGGRLRSVTEIINNFFFKYFFFSTRSRFRLGAVHDGSPPPTYLGGPGAEKCRWEDGYIMSDLRHTEKGFRWSPCSVSSFHHFLKFVQTDDSNMLLARATGRTNRVHTLVARAFIWVQGVGLFFRFGISIQRVEPWRCQRVPVRRSRHSEREEKGGGLGKLMHERQNIHSEFTPPSVLDIPQIVFEVHKNNRLKTSTKRPCCLDITVRLVLYDPAHRHELQQRTSFRYWAHVLRFELAIPLLRYAKRSDGLNKVSDTILVCTGHNPFTEISIKIFFSI
jgi:hypothetical protein